MAQINFKGKQFVQNYHLGVKYHELIPKHDKSLTDKISLHDNLIIHGDNLAALKALLPTYAGKVKCIYIDPPYNTGNEGWVYNDNMNNPMMKEWLGHVVDKEDMTRHDKWLCMMMPRLKLLRELLRDDGVIFISIDDNEQHRLRMLMDEVFGEENFITDLIWQKKTGASDAKNIAKITEFILVYTKTSYNTYDTFQRNNDSYDIDRYKLSDDFNDSRGNYYIDNLDRGGLQYSDSLNFPILCPDGSLTYPNGRLEYKNDGWIWKWSKKKVDWAIANGFIEFRKSKSKQSGWAVCYKNYLLVDNENSQIERSAPVKNLITDVLNADSAASLKAIFKDNVFKYSKPVDLLKKILSFIKWGNNDIVIDSFAGSGTSAQAVLELNKEDGVNRKFILVEMEDYADKITAERVRRVIKGVKGAKSDNLQKGLGGSFSYFELGKPIEVESILSGSNLPSYEELARYIFYTATGEEFNEKKIDEKKNFIGESKEYEVYLFYKPELDYLKNTALTLDRAKELGKPNGKRRLVFAPTKYLDQSYLDELRIDFAQLPFEIYKLVK